MKNGFKITDAHCHIYPEKIAAKAVTGIETFYEADPFPGNGTVPDLIRLGGENGVDRFIVQSVATSAHQVRSINEFIASRVSQYPDKLTGLGTLFPGSPTLREDYEHLRSLGLRGIKLHPDFQGFKIDDYRCLEIYEMCERDNFPILMHTGDSRYDNSNPNRMLPILQIYTGLTVTGAHFGGWSVWDEAKSKLAGIPNFYVDTSSSMHYINDPRKVRSLIDAYGADHVLFGTDYPMWSPEYELDWLFKLGLGDEEMRMILSENAEKLYGAI